MVTITLLVPIARGKVACALGSITHLQDIYIFFPLLQILHIIAFLFFTLFYQVFRI